MVWTILALVLWVVLGGFISYYGDLQGRRWGKRRVSWFGLRPKHTAILITSLTGGFIALFSVASLMIIVPTVRDVVTHGENAIQENKRLIAEETRQRLRDKREREGADRAARLTQEANDKLLTDGRSKLAALQSQLNKAQSSLAPLNLRIAELNARERGLTFQQTKLKLSNKQLASTNATEDVINNQLATQNVDFGHQNIELAKTNRAIQIDNEKLRQINIDLKKKGDGLVETNDSFYHSNVSLESAKNALEKQVADLTHDRDENIELIHQRDQLNAQMRDLGSRIAQQNRMLRQGYVILRAGVELGRISMDAHLRPAAIKNQVGALMNAASEQAKGFGAEPGEEGQAACLPPQPTYTLTGHEDKNENAQVDSLAEEWSGSDSSYVVVATTLSNCLAGEPAYVELHRYPVVRVFAKGAEVASRTIDGHSKVDDIISNLMAFLQKDVQKSALQAGIIPRVDPETGISEVGVLGTADLFRLTDTVRRMRGPVLLTARAKQDVSSADRLNLTFKVSRLPNQPQAVATDY